MIYLLKRSIICDNCVLKWYIYCKLSYIHNAVNYAVAMIIITVYVFLLIQSDEEEEIPKEAKMRMKNLGK